MKKIIVYIFIMLILSALFSVGILAQNQIKLPEIPERTVRFASLPFLDHAQGYIGSKQGWFKEVGIELDPSPNGRVILPAQRAALHAQVGFL